MITFRYNGKTIPYTNPSSTVAIASSAIVVVVAGVRGLIGIATDTIAPSAAGALSVEGVHELAALTTDTGTQGVRMYWDSVLSQLTVSAANSTNAGTYNTFAGTLAEPKNNGDTTARVRLPDFNPGSAAPTALTNASLVDNSGGTASATLAVVPGTYNQAQIANAIASLAAQINALTTNLRAAGVIA